MAKTHKYLWEKLASLGNLMQAAHLAMRGKRSLAPAAGFISQWELECVIVQSGDLPYGRNPLK